MLLALLRRNELLCVLTINRQIRYMRADIREEGRFVSSC